MVDWIRKKHTAGRMFSCNFNLLWNRRIRNKSASWFRNSVVTDPDPGLDPYYLAKI
jgi:hypothetical protein